MSDECKTKFRIDVEFNFSFKGKIPETAGLLAISGIFIYNGHTGIWGGTGARV